VFWVYIKINLKDQGVVIEISANTRWIWFQAQYELDTNTAYIWTKATWIWTYAQYCFELKQHVFELTHNMNLKSSLTCIWALHNLKLNLPPFNLQLMPWNTIQLSPDCIFQWIYVIVHLVRMAERAQYLDVVTRVPVGMDSLGISVKRRVSGASKCIFASMKSTNRR
jgi:hypothetical protein